MKNKIIKVGITGGIGSGKSLLSKFIEERGFFVIRSDLIAKDILDNDTNVKEKIINSFSSDIYLNEKIDNVSFAKIIFSDSRKLKKANSIVHPPTIDRINSIINELSKTSKIIFVESALIYETKIEKMFDIIILVYSEKSERLRRTQERDGVSKTEILCRMNNQIPDEKKRIRSHFVIENSTSIEDLKTKTNFILDLIERMVA